MIPQRKAYGHDLVSISNPLRKHLARLSTFILNEHACHSKEADVGFGIIFRKPPLTVESKLLELERSLTRRMNVSVVFTSILPSAI